MIRDCGAGAEEVMHQSGAVRLRRQFGRRGNHSREGFEDGGTGGNDVVAGYGIVPVAPVLPVSLSVIEPTL